MAYLIAWFAGAVIGIGYVFSHNPPMSLSWLWAVVRLIGTLFIPIVVEKVVSQEKERVGVSWWQNAAIIISLAIATMISASGEGHLF